MEVFPWFQLRTCNKWYIFTSVVLFDNNLCNVRCLIDNLFPSISVQPEKTFARLRCLLGGVRSISSSPLLHTHTYCNSYIRSMEIKNAARFISFKKKWCLASYLLTYVVKAARCSLGYRLWLVPRHVACRDLPRQTKVKKVNQFLMFFKLFNMITCE